MDDDPWVAGLIPALEARLARVHVPPEPPDDRAREAPRYPEWRPLVMALRRPADALGAEIVPSRLADVDELCCRVPDIDRARAEVLELAWVASRSWRLPSRDDDHFDAVVTMPVCPANYG